MTSGAFYTHLKSKNGAFRTTLASGLESVLAALPAYRETHGDQWPVEFADYYLGLAHRLALEESRAMISMTPDVIRADPEEQSEHVTLVERIVKEIAKHPPVMGQNRTTIQKHRPFFRRLFGGLTMARAVGPSAAADEIERASKTAALGFRFSVGLGGPDAPLNQSEGY
ncbi:MAG: hypothetical protein WA790_02705 [Sulfitobacter sp.]